MARPQEFDTEQALKQAIDLFWKNGYERTSLNDLLKQMQIQRSSFYNRFGDKHSLFVQALDHYMKDANDGFHSFGNTNLSAGFVNNQVNIADPLAQVIQLPPLNQPANQIAYNTWIANAAHSLGLSVGLKNDIDQAAQLVSVFDWALDEQCNQYSECGSLKPFTDANKAVFNAEYGSGTGFCSADVGAHINGANFQFDFIIVCPRICPSSRRVLLDECF